MHKNWKPQNLLNVQKNLTIPHRKKLHAFEFKEIGIAYYCFWYFNTFLINNNIVNI